MNEDGGGKRMVHWQAGRDLQGGGDLATPIYPRRLRLHSERLKLWCDAMIRLRIALLSNFILPAPREGE